MDKKKINAIYLYSIKKGYVDIVKHIYKWYEPILCNTIFCLIETTGVQLNMFILVYYNHFLKLKFTDCDKQVLLWTTNTEVQK